MFCCFLFLSLPLCNQCSAIFLPANSSNTVLTCNGEITIAINCLKWKVLPLPPLWHYILIMCKQHALLICSHTMEKSMLRSLAVKQSKITQSFGFEVSLCKLCAGNIFAWKKCFRRLQRVSVTIEKWESG